MRPSSPPKTTGEPTGKTTILNILGGMDSLSSGQVLLDGRDISSYNKKKLTSYRRHDIGFVFQFYNLVQNLDSDVNQADARIIIYPSVIMAVPVENINEYFEMTEQKLRDYAGGKADGEPEKDFDQGTAD